MRGRFVLEASADPTEDLDEEQVPQVKAVQAAFDRFAAHCAALARRMMPVASAAAA